MELNRDALKNEIIEAMKAQGFLVNPHLKPATENKTTIKAIHRKKTLELLKSHKKFLTKHIDKARKYSINGKSLNPQEIDLKLIEIKTGTIEADLFFWWNLAWWSLPYERPIGRQMRFMLWDKCHNTPFGLIGLQSPPVRSPLRDKYLGLSNKNSSYSYWINQSMYAQRVGALPPYNELLGGKMVSLSLTSNEIRSSYSTKYQNTVTLMQKRTLPNRLLFLTTTSAYGKSIVYEQLNYDGFPVSKFMGFTAGIGTFQVPELLYNKILVFLKNEGIDVKRGYGTGPSRKLQLINRAFQKLNLGHFTSHNIHRGHYLFENVSNLNSVLHKSSTPLWYNRPFDEMQKYWKKNWCMPRSQRKSIWRDFNNERYFESMQKEIEQFN